MFQRTEDYMVRVLKPFFIAVLSQLLQLKKQKRYDEAALVINTSAEKILGLKPDLILRMPYEHLMAMLRDDTLDGMVKCLVLAELLKESAELYQAQDKLHDSALCTLKSFNVFFEILYVKDSGVLQSFFTPDEFKQRLTEMSQVVDQLTQLDLSDETSFKLIGYYEQTGAFSKAEDLLFEVLETTDDDEAAVERGIAFFKRLRLKSDEALIAGNLPRDEVEEGLEELLEMLD